VTPIRVTEIPAPAAERIEALPEDAQRLVLLRVPAGLTVLEENQVDSQLEPMETHDDADGLELVLGDPSEWSVLALCLLTDSAMGGVPPRLSLEPEQLASSNLEAQNERMAN